MKRLMMGSLVLALVAGATGAADDKKTRVGTCDDAKKQEAYFCDKSNAANDSMVAIGTACRNAKLNVKEACEGIVDKDTEYKSCKMEQKC